MRRRKHATVFCVGEAILDVTIDSIGGRAYPGGSPLNVAVALARLGDHAILRTSLGADMPGRRLREHLASSGVELDALSHAAERTSTSTVTLDDARDARYDFDVSWHVSPCVPEQRIDIFHTGSIAHTMAPGAEDLYELVHAMSGSAIRSFDPNSRPSQSESVVSARDSFWKFATESEVVKLSSDDAGWLFPHLDAGGLLREIAERTNALVVITRGADGAMLRSGGSVAEVPGQSVDVVDTVGAGDAFMAALLHFLAQLVRDGATIDTLTTDQLTRLGANAVSYASLSTTRAGANPPTEAEFRDHRADNVGVADVSGASWQDGALGT